MRKTRQGAFETNSSSTHSISFMRRDRSLEPNHIGIDDDGYMHVEFGDFGWEICTYTDQYSKLSYLLTMALELNGNDVYWGNNIDEEIEKFMETEDFKLINDEIAQKKMAGRLHRSLWMTIIIKAITQELGQLPVAIRYTIRGVGVNSLSMALSICKMHNAQVEIFVRFCILTKFVERCNIHVYTIQNY